MRLKLQTPNHKSQTKGQIQNSKRPLPGAARGFWFFLFRDFAFVWSLGFGIWNFGSVSLSLCGEQVTGELAVKRQEVFEFAERPAVTRNGDQVAITFASKGFCDATVAIEDAAGTIIRHLASGVLGPKAPEPLQKDSLKQTVVWDGKDDQGRYVDDKDSATVRVSLGLKPQFERTLFWSPKKRIGPGNRPLFAAAPEGVYVQEGGGVDHIRLFDHDGNYVRTVYPFPPDYSAAGARADGPKGAAIAALAKVQGLKWIEFPQDGKLFPEWQGLLDGTMLTSGTNTGNSNPTKYGTAASAMSLRPPLTLPSPPWGEGRVRGAGGAGHLALVMRRLNRVATDGTTGGLPLEGPKTMIETPQGDKEPHEAYPISAAFSPEGKWLYLTGYVGQGYGNFMPGVMRMDFAGDKAPELFLGSLKENEHGKENNRFCCPLWVACDSQGRVYVADYMNDRIQVFTPDGQYYRTVPAAKPLRVFVHPRTGHIYVASWLLITRHLPGDAKLKAVFTHLGPVDDPKPVASYPLQLAAYSEGVFMNRTCWTHDLFVDFHAEPPTIWVVPGSGDSTEKLMQLRRSYSPGQWQFSAWAECHYRLYVEKDGKLVEKANFARDAAAAVTRITPASAPACDRQRLYVNPRNGELWVMEGDSGVGKATREMLRINPATGQVTAVPLPFTTEEIAIDLNGLMYLRTDLMVARFDPANWREVPWDYGETFDNPGFDGDGYKLRSAVPLPGSGKPGCFHLGGFAVSPKGHIVVSCYNIQVARARDPNAPAIRETAGKPYTPPLYPGRLRWAEVHVWDKQGNLVYEDAVPGLPMTDGLAMDRDDRIYALVAAQAKWGGKPFPLECAQTLMKFKAKQAKFLSLDGSGVPIPLGPDVAPKRPPDITDGFAGRAWVEGAEWMYGGVGCDGFIPRRGNICSCWNARFALDLFARSFATELGRSCVAVLDSNGNLIMRIGKYGNVDDGMPLVRDGGPANPRPVGGDEVALARPTYVGTHSDRRLFIADYGNYRILSVKLDYHATEKIPLRGIPDRKNAP